MYDFGLFLFDGFQYLLLNRYRKTFFMTWYPFLCPPEVFRSRTKLKVVLRDSKVHFCLEACTGLGSYSSIIFRHETEFLLVHGRGGKKGSVGTVRKP